MKTTNDFYVYVYIDPRNLREFYYGKGRGDRRFAHLSDASDSDKAKTIQAIYVEGLEPIIRVVAVGLSEEEALLVEKTLIWKLGTTLTNVATGHFADKFRPHNTLHKSLHGFDFANGVFYVNVGEGEHRNWDDCRKYGFVAAGQSWEKWGSKLYSLNPGDVVVAYLKDAGYVGIGIVAESACPVDDFKVQGRGISTLSLVQPQMHTTTPNDPKEGEHLVRVKWLSSCARSDAKWTSKSGLFTTPMVVANLERQIDTLDFLEREFGVSFQEILSKGVKALSRRKVA